MTTQTRQKCAVPSCITILRASKVANCIAYCDVHMDPRAEEEAKEVPRPRHDGRANLKVMKPGPLRVGIILLIETEGPMTALAVSGHFPEFSRLRVQKTIRRMVMLGELVVIDRVDSPGCGPPLVNVYGRPT